ncbi:MAG TPA: TIGR01906 family membrane protein [Anaerolineales bacterium]|nr:TIGR01906 family membrane protein [Anaerolineales bacterium]
MKSILSLLVTLLVPFALIGIGLRILLTPLFLQIEYNMPYFPRDEYGFTKEDRLKWAPYALDYLTNSEGISYLSELEFDDGTPLYNERELSHMDDVKLVTQGALRVWYVTLALLLLLGVWAWFGRSASAAQWWADYLFGLRRGGWLIVGLAVTIGMIVVIGIAVNPNVFWDFFAGFHSLFFEGDSWMFLYSDTLIRLFPLRFWQDAFLWAAAIALAGGVGLALGLKPK